MAYSCRMWSPGFPGHMILFLLCVISLNCAAVEIPTAPVQLPATLPEIEIMGTGDVTLLLIPCMSCRWRQFDEFMQRNSQRYRMIAVTLPGFGGTPLPDLSYQPDQRPWRNNALAALSAVVGKHNKGKLFIIGHSFGSSFAVELADRYPQRVTGVINVDGFIAWGRGEGIWRIPDTPEEQMQVLVEETHGPAMQPLYDAEQWRKFNLPRISNVERQLLYHGMFMATDRRALFAYWSENLFFDVDQVLAKLKMPVLDIDAVREEKNLLTVARQRTLELQSTGIGDNLQQTIILGSGHFVMEDQPAVLDQVIEDFIAGKLIKPVYRSQAAQQHEE